MKRSSYLFCLLLIFIVTGISEAANHYIRSGATGSNNGNDWTNAYTSLPSTLVRGDTYYIASGNYSGRTFNTATSGTAVITIKGATVADHGTDTGWNNSYSVENTQAVWTSSITFSTSFWVFDGSVGPTWSKTPSQYGFAFSTMSKPISIYNTSSTITNVTVSHIAATAPSGDVEKFFLQTHNQTRAVSNVTISHNYMSGWQNGYWATSAGYTMDNWVFEYNVCLNGYSSASNHGEWVNNNYGYMTNQVTRYNLFESGGNGATGVVVANNNDNVNAQIYGNVVKDMTVSNGIFTSTSQGTMQNARIYNNTIINTKTSGGWLGMYTSTGSVAYNNLLYNMNASPGGSGYVRDYNAYFSTTNTPSESNRYVGSGSPFVNVSGGDLHLSAAAATAITGGVILPSPYNVDVDGKIRGADGIVDRGAYEYNAGSAQPRPSVPLSLQ